MSKAKTKKRPDDETTTTMTVRLLRKQLAEIRKMSGEFHLAPSAFARLLLLNSLDEFKKRTAEQRLTKSISTSTGKIKRLGEKLSEISSQTISATL